MCFLKRTYLIPSRAWIWISSSRSGCEAFLSKEPDSDSESGSFKLLAGPVPPSVLTIPGRSRWRTCDIFRTIQSLLFSQVLRTPSLLGNVDILGAKVPVVMGVNTYLRLNPLVFRDFVLIYGVFGFFGPIRAVLLAVQRDARPVFQPDCDPVRPNGVR